MLSAPNTIAKINAITLPPRVRCPGRSRASSTNQSIQPLDPQAAQQASRRADPASDTTRSSSNSTRRPSQSDRLVISCTIPSDLLTAGPRLRTQPEKSPAQEVISRDPLGRNPTECPWWIQAKGPRIAGNPPPAA